MRLSDIKKFKNQQGEVETSNFNELPKKINTIGYYSKKWIIFEDGRVLLKRCPSKAFEQYGQLISGEILKRVGLDCAKYEIATKDNSNEYLISYSFENEDTNLINANEIIKKREHDTINNSLLLIDKYIRSKPQAEKIKEDRIKLFVNEIFTFNHDNKAENWGLLNSFGNYKMSPAFDHGGIFRLNWPELDSTFDTNNILSDTSLYRFHTSLFKNRETFEEVIKELDRLLNSNVYNRFEICKYKDIISDEIRKYSTIDLKDVLKTVEEQYNINIPSIAKKRCFDFFKQSQLVFSKLIDSYENTTTKER